MTPPLSHEQHPVLYIVHCVDTEGPLFESLEATFERIERTFGLTYAASREQLARLRAGHDLPDALRAQVMEYLAPGRMAYNTSWTEVDAMLEELLSPAWREARGDDFGQGYRFNWFPVDHVGYTFNPRQRALGYHSVYTHYREALRLHGVDRDRVYWHFHPVSYFGEAIKSSNNFSHTNEHIQVLSRRIIDFLDFPAAFRPGFHCERPDINLFLEQWIPFDYGNQGMPERPEEAVQRDLSGGRYGDWRRATDQWEVYHPDWYDYQKKGSMRRMIARCLNLDARIRTITEDEIDKAFATADRLGSAILSVTDHDEREMRPRIDWFMRTVRAVQKRHPRVRIRHETAVDAIRKNQNLTPRPPVRLDLSWDGDRLDVAADSPLWGPQPWLCFKTLGRQYIHENCDNQGDGRWSFVFDEDTVTLDRLEAIGLATNDPYGNTSVYRLSPDRDLAKTAVRHHNTDETD